MNSGAGQSASARSAYEAIAPVYDEFTAHHDFELWLSHLLPKVEEHGLSGRRLLDVGCGTGKSFLAMVSRGWTVTACDISPAMLKIAREKAGDRASLFVADMRELPTFGSFDLVWCLDDALNYLLDHRELTQALKGIRRNLGEDGLLMFDVNTIRVFRTFFAEEILVEKGDTCLIWKGLSSRDAPPNTIAEASFHVERPHGIDAPVIPPRLHRERHFPEARVLEALDRSGLECLEVYGHGDDAVPSQPLDEDQHMKAVYIARAAS